jgi:hypothetical protein
MSFRYRDIKAFQLSYRLAMDIFERQRIFQNARWSIKFADHQEVFRKYCEAWKSVDMRRCLYQRLLILPVKQARPKWLDLPRICLPVNDFDRLIDGYDEANRMLNGMIEKQINFALISLCFRLLPKCLLY